MVAYVLGVICLSGGGGGVIYHRCREALLSSTPLILVHDDSGVSIEELRAACPPDLTHVLDGARAAKVANATVAASECHSIPARYLLAHNQLPNINCRLLPNIIVGN